MLVLTDEEDAMRDHFRGLALVLILPLGVWGAIQARGPVPPGAPSPLEDQGGIGRSW